MTYVRQGPWVAGGPPGISAARLNAMEDGILAAQFDAVLVVDYNNATAPGNYQAANTAANRPDDDWYIFESLAIGPGGNECIQVAYSLTANGKRRQRYRDHGGVWTAWINPLAADAPTWVKVNAFGGADPAFGINSGVGGWVHTRDAYNGNVEYVAYAKYPNGDVQWKGSAAWNSGGTSGANPTIVSLPASLAPNRTQEWICPVWTGTAFEQWGVVIDGRVAPGTAPRIYLDTGTRTPPTVGGWRIFLDNIRYRVGDGTAA